MTIINYILSVGLIALIYEFVNGAFWSYLGTLGADFINHVWKHIIK